MKEMVGGCCVCSDERGWPENPLVYCDGQGCTVAVHQACYGIVTVPTGPWYCRKCESQERSARVRCELCPSRDGALKRTDNAGWAHVVCALYIPEVRFGNVTTMEPIILQLIPPERFNKVCYICEEIGKGGRATVGACMQCNKAGCKQQFHVTCAQALGLLCEEAGNYLDNVKYCGYCQHHYSKLISSKKSNYLTQKSLKFHNLKKSGNVKTIPPYKPIPTDNHSSDSSPEKESEVAGGGTMGKSSSTTTSGSTSSGSKRKSSASSLKSNASNTKSGSSVSKSSNSQNSHQKSVHNSSTTKVSTSNEKSSTKNSSSSQSNIKSSSSVVTSKQNTDIEHSTVGSSVSETDKSDKNSSVADRNVIATNKEISRTSNLSKFTTANFTETVVTASESVFGDKSDSNLSVNSAAPKDQNVNKSINKKRKVGSRTPTPNSTVAQNDLEKTVSSSVSTIVSSNNTTPVLGSSVNSGLSRTSPPQVVNSIISTGDTVKDNFSTTVVTSVESLEKVKKMKTDHVPTITSAASIQSSSVSNTSSQLITSNEPNLTSSAHMTGVSTNVIKPPTHSPQTNSLVVSVPLTNTSSSVLSNQTSVVTNAPTLFQQVMQGVRTTSSSAVINPSVALEPLSQSSLYSGDVSGGSLKISYEKQNMPSTSGVTRQSTTTPSTAAPTVPSPENEVPEKRARSQSLDKQDKGGRGKKRGSAGNSATNNIPPTPPINANKRSSRSQHPTPPPANQQGAFSSVTQPIKESPPSSPGSEHTNQSTMKKNRGRKTAAALNQNQSSQDSKDIKIFQNGVHAPHMLGNQLNPNSHMAQKMSDHLNSELEAHSIYTPDALPANSLVGPQLHSRVIASARSSNPNIQNTNSNMSTSTCGNSNFSSMLGAAGGASGTNIPQTLDQLLERQWEQGSQFLMEQAQHFDIASLLSCLHQLRAENLRLEEHVSSLLQRRDHLLAVNARLAIPLTTQPQQQAAAPSQSHTVNNIHPGVTAAHADVPPPRSRPSGPSGYSGQPVENGLPPETAPAQQQYPLQHRSSSSNQAQPSPTIRHSPATSSYVPNSTHGVVRTSSSSRNTMSSDTGRGGPAPLPPHSQPNYASYHQGQVPVVTTQHQQMIIRREADLHHQMPPSKPS